MKISFKEKGKIKTFSGEKKKRLICYQPTCNTRNANKSFSNKKTSNQNSNLEVEYRNNKYEDKYKRLDFLIS